MLNSDAAKDKKLLNELKRFVEAAEAGDWEFSLSADGLSDDDAEAIRLLKTATGKYRSSLENDIMKAVTEQKQTEEQLKRRELMMDALNKASVVFVSRNEDTLEENMTAGVRLIADVAGVDNVTVYRNYQEAGEWCGSQTYRWNRESGGTTKPTDKFTNTTYAQYVPSWEGIFKDGKTVNAPVKMMPETEQATLKVFGTLSAFGVPVFVNNIFWGFVLYEDMQKERYFEDDCADMLRYAAFLLVNATIRYETERKIAEAEERMKLMLDTSPMCCQLFDRNLDTIDCNEAAVRLYGLKDKQEYMERFIRDCSPEYQPDGRRSDEKAAEFIKKAFKEGLHVFYWMHRIPGDGSPMPSEITLYRVSYKDDYAIIGYTRDLREHYKMMKDIAQRDTLLQAVNSAAGLLLNADMLSFAENLCESMMELAKAVHVDRVRVWKNHKVGGDLYCSLLHEWSEGVSPQPSPDYTSGISFSEKIPGWEKKLSNGNCINNIVREMSPEEQAQLSPQGVVSILVVPVLIDEHFWGFVGFDDCRAERIFTETEEKLLRSGSLLIANAMLRHEMFINLRDTSIQLESALNDANEASRVKSAFLANMSHEIRTPMNSIRGFAELAQYDDISDVTKDYLSKISENVDWLLHIINDILDISKIESGKVTLERLPFNLHDIFEHCQSMIMPKIREKGLSMYCYAEPSVGKNLLGDPVKLCQILTNLLSNAVKFTNSGTIKFLASVVKTTPNSTTIHFEVKDSGIGMSPEQIAAVFEPFVQADNNITRRYGGTGLGLAITKNFIELMGGALGVTSAVGVGSKFSFELYFDLIDAPAFSPQEEVTLKHLEIPVFKGEVLICEDNDMNQQVICDYLARVGIKTAVARNGKEAVDIVSDRLKNGGKSFDLIFMDIHMPVMDGLEAATKISDMGVSTPIVALTANVMINDLELYKKSGMSEYLGKPFASQDLYNCLMKYFTPLDFSVVDERRRDMDDAKLRNVLILNFVKNKQTICADIKEAISAGDINLARRLAHSLKSNAGNINEKRLSEAAAAVESMLKDNINLPADEQMDVLEAELKSVLEKYAPMITEDSAPDTTKIVDETKIGELIERLEPMLVDQNMECMDMLGDIRSIPGAGELARQMEDFEFEQAVFALKKFKEGRAKQ